MRNNGFIGTVIGVIVLVIVITAVAVPLISGMQVTTESEVDNTGQESKWTQLGTDASVEVSLTSDMDLVINGTTYQTGGAITFVLATNTFMVSQAGPFLCSPVDDYGTRGKITFDGGTATFYEQNNTDVAGTLTYEWVMIPDQDGDWGLFEQGATVHIDDGADAYAIRFTTASASSSDRSVSLASFQGGSTETTAIYSYYMDNMTFTPDTSTCTLIRDGDAYTGTTWNPASGAIPENYIGAYIDGILAPMTYTAEVADPDDPINSMISLVPLLMIVGVVVATVATFLTYKLKES